jgi:class 3 adenylate cyclase
MSLADSGEVLASEATVVAADARLADVGFQQLGPVVMKGIPTPINLFRVERVA